MLVDVRWERVDTGFRSSETLTDELAACLERFLDSTADETTLSRARRAVEIWHELAAARALPLTG